MRSLRTLLAAGLASAAAVEAPVYTFGPSSHQATGRPPSISAANARLYLAQRLGLSQFESLGLADNTTLQLLNTERVGQIPLFSDAGEQDTRRSLIIVEDIEDAEHFFPADVRPSFFIENPPSQSSTISLSMGFRDHDCSKKGKPRLCWDEIFRSDSGYAHEDRGDGQIIKHHVELLEDNPHLEGKVGSVYGSLRQEMYKRINSSDTATTIIFMPPSEYRSTSSDDWWGGSDVSARRHVARQETPLSENSPRPSDSRKISNAPASPFAKNGTTPKTTIPSCYSSEKNCISATANCTGHGSCNKKFTERVSDDEEGAECWACACGVTEIPQEGGGKQVTYWGGPACQKKDVSVPFFLLAGFTIAMVSAVTWGIGLLYSIGNEELPSVLGAGVAGPTARK